MDYMLIVQCGHLTLESTLSMRHLTLESTLSVGHFTSESTLTVLSKVAIVRIPSLM